MENIQGKGNFSYPSMLFYQGGQTQYCVGKGLYVGFGLEPCSKLSTVTRKCIFLNPFPNKPWILRVCSISLLKTWWEKKKLLVTSDFSFSHSVFYSFGELSAF